jgi:hypothetical protein
VTLPSQPNDDVFGSALTALHRATGGIDSGVGRRLHELRLVSLGPRFARQGWYDNDTAAPLTWRITILQDQTPTTTKRFRHVWPIAVIACGVVLSAAWALILGYEFVSLVIRAV